MIREKSLFYVLGILSFLAACQPRPARFTPTMPATPAATPTNTPMPTGQPTTSSAPARLVAISEIVNRVESRLTAEADFAPVAEGEKLPLQGEVASREDSRARLDVLPDGTIIRIGPNTYLQLAALAPQKPQTRLELFFGQLWILLNGGSLDVQTDSGTASVRGSLLGVKFDAQSGLLTAACLEGHCALSNDLGSVQLTSGQTASIPGPNQAPTSPQPINPEQLQEWQAMPEALPFLPPGFNTSGITVEFNFVCTEGTTPLEGPVQAHIEGNGQTYDETIQEGEDRTIELPDGEYTLTLTFADGMVSTFQITENTGFELCVKE